jgi:hypothetical protein
MLDKENMQELIKVIKFNCIFKNHDFKNLSFNIKIIDKTFKFKTAKFIIVKGNIFIYNKYLLILFEFL